MHVDAIEECALLIRWLAGLSHLPVKFWRGSFLTKARRNMTMLCVGLPMQRLHRMAQQQHSSSSRLCLPSTMVQAHMGRLQLVVSTTQLYADPLPCQPLLHKSHQHCLTCCSPRVCRLATLRVNIIAAPACPDLAVCLTIAQNCPFFAYTSDAHLTAFPAY